MALVKGRKYIVPQPDKKEGWVIERLVWDQREPNIDLADRSDYISLAVLAWNFKKPSEPYPLDIGSNEFNYIWVECKGYRIREITILSAQHRVPSEENTFIAESTTTAQLAERLHEAIEHPRYLDWPQRGLADVVAFRPG